jgi:hypothetical protein
MELQVFQTPKTTSQVGENQSNKAQTDIRIAAYANGIRDTDKSLEDFFVQCSASSLDECAFWSPTAGAIESRLNKLYDSLHNESLPVTTQSGYGYGILDYSTLRVAVLTSLYRPYERFPPLAQGLKELEEGNGTAIFDMVYGGSSKITCDASSDNTGLADVSAAIYCGDSKGIDDTPSQLHEKYLQMKEDYGSFADVWIVGSARCM